jgi:hypothetical protein
MQGGTRHETTRPSNAAPETGLLAQNHGEPFGGVMFWPPRASSNHSTRNRSTRAYRFPSPNQCRMASRSASILGFTAECVRRKTSATIPGSCLAMNGHRKACRRFNEPGQAHALTFSCFCPRLPRLSDKVEARAKSVSAFQASCVRFGLHSRACARLRPLAVESVSVGAADRPLFERDHGINAVGHGTDANAHRREQSGSASTNTGLSLPVS